MTSLDQVRAHFARNEGLPFADVPTEASILDALNEHGLETGTTDTYSLLLV